MQLKDLSISAKLTLATTSVMLGVYILVSAGILTTMQGGGKTAPAAAPEETRMALARSQVRAVESAGSLLLETARPLLNDQGTLDETGRARLRPLVAQVARNSAFSLVDLVGRDGMSLLTPGVAPPAPPSFRRFPLLRDGEERAAVVIGLAGPWLPTAAPAAPTGELTGDPMGEQGAIVTIIAIILIGAVATAVIIQYSIARLTERFIRIPAQRIQNALWEMERRRDYSSRVSAEADDELGNTVDAFNRALDFLDRQNNRLNDSVIEVLESAGRISQLHDLTIRVPVHEDITGPLGDALNRLTKETAKVLQKVQVIAEQVSVASEQVQAQGRRVVEVADREQALIETSSSELSEAIKAIDAIAELAQFCNDSAREATTSTQAALEAMGEIVAGMGSIRDSIQETGKRIKRLGERSQEISGIVDIINSFSERTHVLAINASMEAVNSGAAGKGFAVVAQEVQRLADNSRTATSQIANLIGNIQVETGDAIQTVNQATETVTAQSATVERASDQMRLTQQKNATLAEAVQKIFDRSRYQAAANSRLLEQIGSMRAGTTETTSQLVQQTEQTNRLVAFSGQLLEAIRLFRVPALEAPAASGPADAKAG